MKKYVMLLVIFLVGYGAGRWSTPAEVMTKTKIVEVMSQNESINTKEVITEKPDGTKITVRTYHKETKKVLKKLISQKTIKKSHLNYGISVGKSIKKDQYIILVDRRIILNLNMGIYTNLDNMKFKDTGVYLRYSF